MLLDLRLAQPRNARRKRLHRLHNVCAGSRSANEISIRECAVAGKHVRADTLASPSGNDCRRFVHERGFDDTAILVDRRKHLSPPSLHPHGDFADRAEG